ncbi:Aste57867_12661 [Aphanomyces stellatus]|uniref:Aste57867_12661 protein n=1 Tax=Aphanomyces stellatus TaxID=120398 RepID=A0A485KY62_9STRA|nr:hypothetical protein As57867_012615 [Aphanomyces stellatus]VFT89511.1 Aste57867_12661 [Aphanomyces stellatus]
MVSIHVPTPSTAIYDALPFDEAAITSSIDVNNCTYLVVSSCDKSNRLVLEYVAKHLVKESDHRSFGVNTGKKRRHDCYYDSDDDDDNDVKSKTSTLLAGAGLHRFTWKDTELFCLCQFIGAPVGTEEGAARMENVVLFSPKVHTETTLHTFVDELVAASEATKKGVIKIFRWNVKNEYWRETETTRARSLDSVILPRDVTSKLTADLDDFVRNDTKAFYLDHGIPYKRSYLFHGIPGAGKTSLIQAIGGQYGRNLFFLQPTHPNMTDDSLREAFEDAPRNSIVVLEDIDALFDEHRNCKVRDSKLTFSGLLNAIDGVGCSDGHIVVLTTNFRNQLDDALIRNGRVDVHVAFEHTVPEQMEAMFQAFYSREDDAAKAKVFAAALVAALDGREMSTAALQHYFVTQRRKAADEAIENVGEIVRNLDERKKSAEESKDESDDEQDDTNTKKQKTQDLSDGDDGKDITTQ